MKKQYARTVGEVERGTLKNKGLLSEPKKYRYNKIKFIYLLFSF